MAIKDFVEGLFSSGPKKKAYAVIEKINSLEEEFSKLSKEELRKKSEDLKQKVRSGTKLDDILLEAFALVREAAKRTLNQRHFDVQLLGGVAIHEGKIAEMRTGEGKTLAATAPVYLNALTERGVHVVTVNDYLAKRDTVWMGQIYHALGLKTACLVHDTAYIYDPEWRIAEEGKEMIDKERDETGSFRVQEEFLRPIARREAYEADITYGTNHEFGFDYLRDNLVHNFTQQVQRGHHFAIIDEVDSILIDEARTPLIISAPDTSSSEYYKIFARVVDHLKKDEDYEVDEKTRSVEILESGINKVEKLINVKDLYAPENIQLVRYLEACLKAKALFERDRDYIVKEGEIIIVDQFTGRLMQGRRYSLGLHQAIEAKEGVPVKEESKTFAQISIQNYFRLYEKLSGMTGTAQTSAEEFHKVYNLEVETIPTNKPMVRNDLVDVIYKTLDAKYRAIVKEVKERQEKGQPILIGTVSIEKNEVISKMLKAAGISYEVLNAKNHEREGAIIAQAGKPGAVTVATNMAGRGVDIILGGNPSSLEETQKVKDLGGLHIIGTERHEARRIDDQLRGRAGRQGDPGSSQFFLSLEDDLARVFGGSQVKSIMEAAKIPDDVPIDSKIVTKSIAGAQARVEGFNFDARKHLLDFDDVLNKQRTAMYKKRQEILEMMDKEKIKDTLKNIFKNSLERFRIAELTEDQLKNVVKESNIIKSEDEIKDKITIDKVKDIVDEKIEKYENIGLMKSPILAVLDNFWMNHLADMEHHAESVRIRAYGQRDPLTEYRREGAKLFEQLTVNFETWMFNNMFRLTFKEQSSDAQETEFAKREDGVKYKDVGRNDPCPCGSGKKYKRCHGR